MCADLGLGNKQGTWRSLELGDRQGCRVLDSHLSDIDGLCLGPYSPG